MSSTILIMHTINKKLKVTHAKTADQIFIKFWKDVVSVLGQKPRAKPYAEASTIKIY